MEMRHLRVFAVIVEERSISRAARRLRIAQPAVSRTLAQLEGHLGVRLLERSSQGIVVTPAGQTFQVKAMAALAAFTAAVDRPVGQIPPLRVGHVWSGFGPHTSRLLRAWRDRHHRGKLQLRQLANPLCGLAEGSIDIAVLRGRQSGPPYVTELLYQESRVAAFPLDHPLAVRERVLLGELGEEKMVVNTGIDATDLEVWGSWGRPPIAVEVDTAEDWKTAIAAGAGFGVAPASSAALSRHAEIAYIPVIDAPLLDVFLVWPENSRHPRIPEFLRLAHDVVNGSGERS